MDLLTYVRALRRRWLLIVSCVVLGAVVGYGTTLLHTEATVRKGRTYYKATNTVLVDFSSNEGGISPALSSLDQVALVVTTGEVPQRVADKLQTAQELGERIITTTNALTSTLEITAVDANRERAAQVADTFAAELDATLQERDQQRFETAIADLNEKLDKLQTELDTLNAQLFAVPPPPDRDTIQRKYNATSFNYIQRYSELQTRSAAGPASTSVTVLETAVPDPIGQEEYDARLELGATGQNHQSIGTDGGGNAPVAIGTSSSSFNSPVGRAFAGGFLGLLVGIGIALFLERLDRRMRTREEVERAFQLPVLAEVPRLTRKDQAEDQLVAFSAPLSRVAEAFRAVRTSLVFQQSIARDGSNGSSNVAANGNGSGTATGNGNGSAPIVERASNDPLVVMVTSAAPREGKSTTSANLAVAFAEGGASVLVVNCDFRRPTIHRRFGVLDEPLCVQDTLVPRVRIVTNVLGDAGANPSQVVAAQRQVIAAARGRFDVVLLDTAPMLTANDAVGIVDAVDLVLLVARLDMTTSDNAHRVMEMLARVHATVSGVVLIGASDASNEYYYYYQRERVATELQEVGLPETDPPEVELNSPPPGVPAAPPRGLVADGADEPITP